MPRGRSERRWDDDTANTLLGLLDGIKSTEGLEVIWMVASNFDEAHSPTIARNHGRRSDRKRAGRNSLR